MRWLREWAQQRSSQIRAYGYGEGPGAQLARRRPEIGNKKTVVEASYSRLVSTLVSGPSLTPNDDGGRYWV